MKNKAISARLIIHKIGPRLAVNNDIYPNRWRQRLCSPNSVKTQWSIRMYKKFSTVFKLLLSIVALSLLTNGHLHAQSTETEDLPFGLFLPFVSFDGDPTLSTEEQEMLFAPEEDIDLVDLPISAAAAATEIAPISYKTLKGKDGGQPVAALAIQDFPDTSNPIYWEKYI